MDKFEMQHPPDYVIDETTKEFKYINSPALDSYFRTPVKELKAIFDKLTKEQLETAYIKDSCLYVEETDKELKQRIRKEKKQQEKEWDEYNAWLVENRVDVERHLLIEKAKNDSNWQEIARQIHIALEKHRLDNNKHLI